VEEYTATLGGDGLARISRHRPGSLWQLRAARAAATGGGDRQCWWRRRGDSVGTNQGPRAS